MNYLCSYKVEGEGFKHSRIVLTEQQQSRRVPTMRNDGVFLCLSAFIVLALMVLSSPPVAAQASATSGGNTPVTMANGFHGFSAVGPPSVTATNKKSASRIKANLASGSVAVTNYFSNNLFDEISTSVITGTGMWLVMHDCCDLTFLDDPPESYTFSSSCPQLVFSPQTATITAADDSSAESYFTGIGDPGPYTWDEFWMSTGTSVVGWVDQPTSCTINASSNGQIVATATMVIPPSKKPSEDPGNETAPCDSCEGGDPISLQTGNVTIIQRDVHLPGLGGGLTLDRSWNSVFPFTTQSSSNVGMFGPYWRSTYEESVFVNLQSNVNNVKYQRNDGSFWTFAWNSSGTGYQLISPANTGATLTASNSYWTVTFKSGEKRLFSNTNGKLAAIIDRNGNVTELTYDALNRVTSVSDPAGRHLYFAYGAAGSEVTGNGSVVTKVTSDAGITLSYTYDPVLGSLETVTKPDGTNTYFQYQAGFISAVLDTNGKVLESHTYDQYGRGLTSSRANGVGAITMTYPNN